MITGFQCDTCHVRSIKCREPVVDDFQEDLMLLCLRRAILDSLWSRESSTVRSNLNRAWENEDLGDELSYYASTPQLGPYPLRDSFGMKTATIMIHKSSQPGRNAATVQYDTIRQLRTGYSNIYHASSWQETISVMASDLKKLHITSCPTDDIWFGKFMLGMQKRLGRQIKQDCGLSIGVMHKVQELLEADWEESEGDVEARRGIVEVALIFYGTFCWGLRGEDLLLITMCGTRRVWQHCVAHRTPHVMLALVGRRKRLPGSRAFLLPCVPETNTGLKPGLWVERMLTTMLMAGISRGYLLVRDDGQKPKLADYAEAFTRMLERVQAADTSLISQEIEVGDIYGIRRSGRRGVTTHMRNVGVSGDDIRAHHNWARTEHNVGSSRLTGNMLDYYTEVEQLLPTLLRCSQKQ